MWFEDGGFVPKAGPGVFFPLVVAPVVMDEPVTDEIRAEADRFARDSLKRIIDEERPTWSRRDG